MKLLELMQDTKFNLLQSDLEKDIKQITIDSRKVQKDSLFICIKGFRTDGHKYIASAIEQGCVALLVEDVPEVPEHVTVIQVENCRKAMATVAANFYGNPADFLTLIGVTGTNGKTSTTYFMEAILDTYALKSGVIGTIGARIGEKNMDLHAGTTPDTIELHEILSIIKQERAKHVIMEVSSHALALHKVNGINFHAAIFTNLTQDHLDLHGDMESYLKEKAKLFRMCTLGFVNADDPASEYIIQNATCKITTFSINNPSDFQATNIEYLNSGVAFDLTIKGEKVRFTIPVAGQFTVYNTLGVISCACGLGIPAEVIRHGLKNMKGVPGRIQSVPNDKGFSVIVDYAHTPDGLDNIIKSVRGFTKGRVITIFGCGGDRDPTKRPIMGEIAGRLSDYCVITSDNPRTEDPQSILDQIETATVKTDCPYVKIIDRKEAIGHAISIAKPEDSVIIAGKGHENYQIFPDRTIHFDDFEVALEFLNDRK